MDQAKSMIKLFHAQLPVPKICAKLNAARSAIFYVKKRLELIGETGWIPGQSRKRSTQLVKIKDKLEKDLFKSMRLKWFSNNGISFWPKEIWLPNSPDVTPLDFFCMDGCALEGLCR